MPDQLERLATVLADRYRIERELGQGGMATVYLAQDIKHDRKVAIKVLRPELAAVLGHERFLREITTTANLRHPHILPLYDSGRTGGRPAGPADGGAGDSAEPTANGQPLTANGFLFYVMPFVEGESLRDRLQREKQLPLDEALRITREVADALSYAHARGVIHRDIKPENILLESGHAVVADFGIARAMDAAGGTQLTETGLAVGTPAYMSPEQAAGERDLDGRSDLYALGCVLFEMLAGQPPFTGPSIESVIHQHLSVDAAPITNLRPAVPPGVAEVLRRTLAKTPADRFHPVAQFTDALEASVAGPAPSSSSWRPRVHGGWARVLIGGAILTGAVALLVIWGLRRQGDRRTLESLAVLPLENLSSEPGQDYFVDGMTDALITELSKIEALRIISRTSVMQYKETRKPLPVIARELGADGIVEGSVVRVGDRVRVTAQLIDAAGDRHVWGEAYDRHLGDVLALHSELARAIAGEVRVVLTARDEARLAGAHRVDPRAHDLLLRGRYQAQHGELADAVDLLEQATVADPEYAAAWAALGRTLSSMATEEPTYLPRAKAAVQRALDLDSNLAEVQTARGAIALYHDWDWDTARHALERAIELNPGHDDAHQVYGDYFEVLGQWDEAIAEGIRSKAASPVSASMRLNLGLTLSYTGRFDDAIRECRSALELDSLSSWAYFCLTDAYLRKRDIPEALTAARQALRLDPSDLNRISLALVLTEGDDRDEAEGIVTQLEVEASHRYVSPFHLAWIHNALGDTDRALELLEQAVDVHATWTPLANSLPEFDALRSDPRFQAVLRRMRLPT